jgi:hypothetical protein
MNKEEKETEENFCGKKLLFSGMLQNSTNHIKDRATVK